MFAKVESVRGEREREKERARVSESEGREGESVRGGGSEVFDTIGASRPLELLRD
jgi:hypothetical protein